ncbi:effector binding domain-containing protein [Clostridium sp. C2-6-12]|uniref:AraC family transcriptional regulator n=1 Tax=Clostridium sp. C2-6-12 TaxID=2698832 RepID=UPI00136E1353|nr:effector binding domain-containing protein [Clostridium sp. C2-6-12]
MDEKILGVILKIEREPFEDWSLENVSREAGYSSFHFHRIFKATTGITLFQFVRYRQMQAAAKLVIMEKKFEDIAYQCKFSSAEAFSRAFKNYFGKSPKEFQMNPDKFIKNYEIIEKGVVSMNCKIIELDKDILIVGVPVDTNPSVDFNISSAWKELSEKWNDILYKPDRPRAFGLEKYYSNNMYRSEGITYTACVEVSTADVIPEGMVKDIIPAGTYAAFTHVGPTENLDQTFRYAYTEGLKNEKLIPKGDYDIEVYDERYKEGSPDSKLDIYIPVKPMTE